MKADIRKARKRAIKSTKPLGKRQAEEISPAESIGRIMYGGLSYKTEILDLLDSNLELKWKSGLNKLSRQFPCPVSRFRFLTVRMRCLG
jgi:hypothetical protein